MESTAAPGAKVTAPAGRPGIRLLFGLWLVVVLALTLPAASWHLQRIAKTLPNLHLLFFVALALLCLVAIAYSQLRRRSLWRYEPASLVCLALTTCLWFEPLGTLVCVLLALAALIVGSEVLDRLGFRTDSALEELALGCTLGLGIYSLSLFLLGLVGVLNPTSTVVLLLIPLLLLRRRLVRLPGLFVRMHRNWGAHEQLRNPLAALATVFGATMLVLALMVMLSPSILFDTIKLQFPVIKLFAVQHSLQPFPDFPRSYYPHGLEVLMTAVYGLAGQVPAQIVPVGFFALLLLFVIRLARQCGYGPAAAWLAASVTFCLPFLHIATSGGKNDAAIAVYQLSALSVLLKARSTGHLRWTYIAAFLMGCSLCVKYSAGLGVLPLTLLLIYVSRSRRQAVALALILLALTSAVWPARTAIFASSPFYPFKLTGFVEQLLPERPGSSATPEEGSRKPWSREERSLLSLPWDIHFRGARYFNTILRNPMAFFIPLFLPLAVIRRRQRARPTERMVWFVSAACFLPWAVLAGDVFGTLRFAIVPIAIWVFLLAGRLTRFVDDSPRWLRRLFAAALLYNFTLGFCSAFIVEINQHQLAYFAGSVDQRGYLRHALPGFRALESLEDYLQPSQDVVAVDSCPAAYAPEPWRFRCFMRSYDYQSPKRLVRSLGDLSMDYIIAPSPLRSWLEKEHSLRSEQAFREIWSGPKFTAWRREGTGE